MDEVEDNEVTFLLVGNTGNGKSATANSILGKPFFKTVAGTLLSSSEVARESTRTVDNLTINVIDGSGIDTNKSSEEILKTSIDWMDQALILCNYRFSALVIVLRFGSRLTKQQIDFIGNIKAILGENVIKKYGVCVVTYGDNFYTEFDGDKKEFTEWCQEQSYEMESLLKECNHRCVLFDNKTKDEKIKVSQVSELLKHVSIERKYSKSEYDAAKIKLQKFIILSKAPRILEETKIFVARTRESFLNVSSSANPNNNFQLYHALLETCNKFNTELEKEYGFPKILKESYNIINILRMEINSQLQLCMLTHVNDNEPNANLMTPNSRRNSSPSYQPYDPQKGVRNQSEHHRSRGKGIDVRNQSHGDNNNNCC